MTLNFWFSQIVQSGNLPSVFLDTCFPKIWDRNLFCEHSFLCVCVRVREKETETWKINQLLKVMVTFINSEIRVFLHTLLCSISEWLYHHQNEIAPLHCPYAHRIPLYPKIGFLILYLSYFPPYINLYLMYLSNKYIKSIKNAIKINF